MVRQLGLGVSLLAWAACAHSQSLTCAPTSPPDAYQLASAIHLAQKVADGVETLPDDVLLIARRGQDLSSYGLTYSHVGILVRTEGTWRVWHSLLPCGKQAPSTFEEGLPNFFLDRPSRYETKVWRLRPAVQTALRSAVQSADSPAKPYSLIANPWVGQFENSNTWVIRQFAKALANTDGSDTAVTTWLQKTGYQPSSLKVGYPVTLASLFSPYIQASDQQDTGLGIITVDTADSTLAWLERQHWCHANTCEDSALTFGDPAD